MERWQDIHRAPRRAANKMQKEAQIWNSIKRQLYKPEASLVERLVGEKLIQQNRLMWDEITSLRQMLADYQEQNDQFADGQKSQIDFCDTQHRDLLKRQAQIILGDLRSQAEACGHTLEDMLPELRTDKKLRDCMFSESSCNKAAELQRGPPATPSTRPSTAGGRSIPCSTPDLIVNLANIPALHMGRQLDMDDIDEVAAGVREALETEHDSLLAAIGEETQRLEAEDARRVQMQSNTVHSEVSTAQLQRFLHKLQDLIVSPQLRTLSLTAPTRTPEPRPISGGSNVRRLQALILNRRQTSSHSPLHGVLEAPDASVLTAFDHSPKFRGETTHSGAAKLFDPFFDDPFASRDS